METSDRELLITHIINAPREHVWEAWTDVKKLAFWWGANGYSTTVETMDLKPGGLWKLVMRSPEGHDYSNKSIFVEVVENERIVYSNAGGKRGGPPIHFEATWTFKKAGEKTEIIVHLQFASGRERDMAAKQYRLRESMTETLGRLGDYLEKETTPRIA
jgi:uncharacterized protein YndB with AHSA1/START domain